MIKTLTKHGNSYALIIDRAILDLLKITPETPLELTTDGKSLTIRQADGNGTEDEERRKRLDAILDDLDSRYSNAFRRLAE